MLGVPRRAVVGWDGTRLAMITAVLDARCGLSMGANDIYLNIAGGLRIVEPAADLGIALAIASSFRNVAIPETIAVFGELGLSGEVRPVGMAERRANEARKLGYTHVISPVNASDIVSAIAAALE